MGEDTGEVPGTWLIPQSMTTDPSFTHSPLTISARPAPTTRISARPTWHHTDRKRIIRQETHWVSFSGPWPADLKYICNNNNNHSQYCFVMSPAQVGQVSLSDRWSQWRGSTEAGRASVLQRSYCDQSQRHVFPPQTRLHRNRTWQEVTGELSVIGYFCLEIRSCYWTTVPRMLCCHGESDLAPCSKSVVESKIPFYTLRTQYVCYRSTYFWVNNSSMHLFRRTAQWRTSCRLDWRCVTVVTRVNLASSGILQ